MAGSVYNIGVAIKLMGGGAAALGLTALTKHFNAASTAAVNMNKNIRLAMSGLVSIGVGVGIADLVGKAVVKAADLQMAMKQVQMATMASTGEMENFYQSVQKVSHQTMFSMRQVAMIGKEMAAAGIPKYGIIGPQSMMPQFAAAGEILYRVKGVDPYQTAHALAGIAHQFGYYTPEQMNPIAERIVQLSLRNPATIGQFATMSSYLSPVTSRVLGASAPEILDLIATSLQVSGGGGAGGRGPLSGAQWSNLFGRMIPGVFGSGLLKGHSAFASRVMGFAGPTGISTVFDPVTHKLDINRSMDLLGAFHKQTLTFAGQQQIVARSIAVARQTGDTKALEQLTPLYSNIKAGRMIPPGQLELMIETWMFGTAARTAAIAGGEQFQAQLRLTHEYVAKQKSIADMQQQIQNTVLGSWAQFITDFENVFVTLVYQNLPTIMNWIKVMDSVTNKVAAFNAQHPSLMKGITNLIMATSAFLILGGTIATVSGIVRYANVSFTILGRAMSLMPIMLLATAVYMLWQQWDNIKLIVQDFTHNILPWLGKAFSSLFDWIISKIQSILGITAPTSIVYKNIKTLRTGRADQNFSDLVPKKAQPIHGQGVVIHSMVINGAPTDNIKEWTAKILKELNDKIQVSGWSIQSEPGGIFESPWQHGAA